MGEATSVAFLSGVGSQERFYSLSQILEGGVVWELHGYFSEFGNPFLFNIFEQVVPERDEVNWLIVHLNLLTIKSVNYPPLDFDVVVAC